MPLFLFIFIFYNIHTVQSSNHIHTIHSPRPLSFSSSLVAQWERPPCGAEPGIELGPAFQQADALPTEPRHISVAVLLLGIAVANTRFVYVLTAQ